jgi:hypothetical protein
VASLDAGVVPRPTKGWDIRSLNDCSGGGECFFVAEFVGGAVITPSSVGELANALGFATVPDARVLAPDLPVVGVAGLASELKASFQGQLTAGVGQVTPSPGGDPSVSLAVVDTLLQPLGVVSFPASLPTTHGASLVALTHDLACGTTSPCPVAIRNWGGLPYVVGANPPETGATTGGYGSLVSVGQALQAGLAAWTGSNTKLVVNLSFGWHPVHGGDPMDRCNWTPAMRFLHSKIVDLRQAGALVFAAAGNRTGGPSGGSGYLYPAGWQALGVDDPLACSRPDGAGGSILWSVSGVDGRGNPLPVGRDVAANNQIKAYGDHATTSLNDEALTGTSVATAVVSTAAAIAWASDTTRTAQNVADLMVAGTAGWVDLCAGTDADGPYSGCTSARPAGPPVLPNLSSVTFDFQQAEAVAPVTKPGCAAPVSVVTKPERTPAQSVSWCPEDDLFTLATVTPWLRPQPWTDPCPACVLVVNPPNLDFYFDDPTIINSGASDLSVQLRVNQSGTLSTVRLWLDPALFSTSATAWHIQVNVPDLDESSEVVGARLAMAYPAPVGNVSVIMPLAVFAAPSTP